MLQLVTAADESKLARVSEPLDPLAIERLQLERVHAIELNVAFGWRGGRLSFLAGFNELRRLTVIGGENRDFAAIERLSSLQVLKLHSLSVPRRLDLTRLRRLENLSLDVGTADVSLPEGNQISRIAWNGGTPDVVLSQVENMKKLTSLTLSSNRTQSLDRIRLLPVLDEVNLKLLGKLDNCSFLADLPSLRTLYVNTCKGFRDISAISSLSNLEYLALINVGDVESLLPLSSVRTLERLYFYDKTKVLDGKISFLADLEKLEDISFANRRHYDCRLSDFHFPVSNCFPVSLDF